MARSKLQNYLKTYRKRFGLSQVEMAYLLGCKSPSTVSEYETFQRLPTLPVALAYEYLFKVPIAELFAGMYQQIEEELPKRAAKLHSKSQRRQLDQKTKRKLDFL